MGEKLEHLKSHMATTIDLMHAAALLSWDQEVYMPPQGVEARSQQLATLSTLAHQMFTSDETGELLAEAEAEVAGMDYDSDEASNVRVTRREYDQHTKLPTSLVSEMSLTASQAFAAWRQAREKQDYALFEPHLQKIVDLNRRKADYLGYEAHPYDALLGLFEPGMTTAQVEALFEPLKQGLIPLIQAITAQPQVDDHFLTEPEYDVERQWEFTMLLLRKMGYDFRRGRQDKAPHPFTINFANRDVRVTTRLHPHRPLSAIFGSAHEGGHALYEQGSPDKFERSVLAGGASMGVHESQSRLWENQVSRGKAFWSYYYPILQAFFPEQLEGIPFWEFYRAVNKVEPSFIRVEADEVTYNLHIFVRFELEKSLLTGELSVADLPDAWNAKYQAYLGITPPNDALGCLQDVHWSHGDIGYFPTYTLGNLISAQLYAQIKQEVPGLEDGYRNGEFAPLLTWLREKIHRHARKFTAAELLQRAIGQELDARPLLEYFYQKYAEVYQLEGLTLPAA